MTSEVGGNDGTAFVIVDVCLKPNGFRHVPSEGAEEFFFSIAKGKQTVETIAEWLGDPRSRGGAKE